MGWWLRLGDEEAEAARLCPRPGCTAVPGPTDLACPRHDRLLRTELPPRLRADLARVEVAHLPIYLAFWAAARSRPVPLVLAVVAVAVLGVVAHLYRYPLAARVTGWVLALAALTVGWWTRGGWPSVGALGWLVLLVGTGLCLWSTARSIGEAGAEDEPPSSPVRWLWVATPAAAAGDGDGDEDEDEPAPPPPVGARAARLFVAGVAALVLSLYDGIRRFGTGALRPTVLAMVGLVALIAGLLQLWIVINARWKDGLVEVAGESDPILFAEPAGWDDLAPLDRSLRRFGLRILQAAVLLAPWMRGEPATQQGPGWSRADWMAAALDSCFRHARRPVTAALWRVLAPWLVGLVLVVLAGRCGRMLADVAAGTSGGMVRTFVLAVLVGAGAVAAGAVVVWLVAGGEPVAALASGARTLLVVLPNTIVRVPLVALLVARPTPLAVTVVIVAVLASLAVWTVRNAGT